LPSEFYASQLAVPQYASKLLLSICLGSSQILTFFDILPLNFNALLGQPPHPRPLPAG
jgi:hypothetical protein